MSNQAAVNLNYHLALQDLVVGCNWPAEQRDQTN